jgi:hypothetical protein
LNTGTAEFDFMMKLDSGTPSTIDICANATGEVGVTIDADAVACDLTLGYNSGGFLNLGSIPAGKRMNVTIYANFTNALYSDSYSDVNKLSSS